MPLGAFLRRILFYAPGTAEPSGYSPAELVVYGFELDLKKLVDEFVAAGAAIVVWPWADDPADTAGPFGVGYTTWWPGALRWFQLGGTEGRHVHTTKYTRLEASHKTA